MIVKESGTPNIKIKGVSDSFTIICYIIYSFALLYKDSQHCECAPLDLTIH